MADLKPDFHFDADDGTSIATYVWRPEATPTATVQIAHGMAEHAARYADLAEAFNAEGWVVYANDHRGHGQSVPAGAEPGDMGPDGFVRAARDVIQLGRHIAGEHPDMPRLLFGHSMGSFLVQRVLWQAPETADAVVLSASNGRPPPIATVGRGIARVEQLRLGPAGRSPVIQAMTFDDFNKKFAPTRTDFDWLSRDEAQVDAYIADPLCGFSVSVQSWVSMLDSLGGLLAEENLAQVRRELPVYLIAGTADAVGDMGKGVLRLADTYRAAGLSNVEMKLYVGGRHEMLHETNRTEVVSDIVSWARQALAG
jgi:alpha-beta hydrolase superfamily lysophospholipase